MQILLRFGSYEEPAEIPEDAVQADGVAMIRVVEGGTHIPFRDSGEKTTDGFPVFVYAM